MDQPGEIPGDGIDNDRNGYVDDVHGWYWLRFSDGSMREADQVEAPRLYVEGRTKYDSFDRSGLSAQQHGEWKRYQASKGWALQGFMKGIKAGRMGFVQLA